MDVDGKVNLASRNTVEIVTKEELINAFSENRPLKGYIGFEPSGLVHVGWLVWMFKVKDLVDAGVDFYVLEATWHAYINDKLGGDMELIKKAAKYTRKVLEAIGVDIGKVRFVDAEDLVSDKEYWGLLIKAAKKTTLARVKRALTIMGRATSEAEADFSKLIYPLMQVTDIFYLDLDIALGGLDQRKAHMLARDLAERLGLKKPIAIHTPIISGLLGPAKKPGAADQTSDIDDVLIELKMSKSKPETAIFIHESPEDVKFKIMKAYCPARVLDYNPVIEVNKYILFQQRGFVLYVERPSAYGGPVEIHDVRELEELYVQGKLHPLDLKVATAEALIKFLGDIQRKLFSSKETIKILEELKGARITR